MKALGEAAFRRENREVRRRDVLEAIGIPGIPFSAVLDHTLPLDDAGTALVYAAQSNRKVLLESAP
jgi:hypothetical protein